jgi:hypothetical protein
VLGVADERASLARVSSSRAIPAVVPDDRAAGAREPDAIAAEYAAPASGPLFRTDDARAIWRSGAMRATWLVAAAAAALVVVGAAIQLWGVHRQLDSLRVQRRELAPRLSQTLIGRTSVEAVSRSVGALNAAEHASPAWGATIANITTALPDSAYLTGFRTRGDSLIVEGLAQQASDVFNALEAIPGLANVRAGAPVRRELDEDNMPLERFTIIARQPVSAPVVAAPRTGGTR